MEIFVLKILVYEAKGKGIGNENFNNPCSPQTGITFENNTISIAYIWIMIANT